MHKKQATIFLFFITYSFCSHNLKPTDNNIAKQITTITNTIQKGLFDRSIKNQDQENEQIVYTFKNLTYQQIDAAFFNLEKDIISFYQSISINSINLKTHTEFLKAYLLPASLCFFFCMLNLLAFNCTFSLCSD